MITKFPFAKVSTQNSADTQTATRDLLILGTRGVPASHGGFETFAERLAIYLIARNWNVTVYCQAEDRANITAPVVDEWKGIRRVTLSAPVGGPLGTIWFDWRCVLHAARQRGVPLVLGYNTAVFAILLRILGRPVIMNMDGIEWKRPKWGKLARLWFYLNEWCGELFSSKLIADHPLIGEHLASRRSRQDIIMIPYGADIVRDAPIEPIEAMGLKQNGYFVSIGRIEPENSVLEMVTAYAMRKRRAAFVCVGKLDPNNNAYHAQVITASKGRVLFPGAIYDPDRVRALRFHALAYCHGHTVGGTNPSLVEALGAGNAVIAHNNPFNNWVAGSGQFYFSDVMSCDQAMTLLDTKPELAEPARMRAKSRHSEAFMWSGILQAYEELCLKFTPERKRSHQRRGCNDQVPSCGDHRSDEAGQSLDNI